jgi:hypothetical protein
MSRPFHDDLEDLGFPQKTWNTMARRNQRWGCEQGRIGHDRLRFTAGDPSPCAAAPRPTPERA